MKVNWKQLLKEALVMAVGWYIFWYIFLSAACVRWGL